MILTDLNSDILFLIFKLCIDESFKKLNSIHETFINLRNTNKKLNFLLKDKIFWKKYLRKYEILELYDVYANYNYRDLIYYNKIKDMILIKNRYDSDIFKIFTKIEILQLPKIKKKKIEKGRLLLDDITYPLMRGCDINNKGIIIFRYLSNFDKKILFEVLYCMCNLYNFWSTYGSGTYIFCSAINQTNLLNDKTCNYIKRLITGNAGIFYIDNYPTHKGEDKKNKLILI